MKWQDRKTAVFACGLPQEKCGYFLNTVLLNISKNLSHLELSIMAIQIIVIRSFLVTVH